MFHISAKVNIFLPKINGRDQNDKQRLFKDQSDFFLWTHIKPKNILKKPKNYLSLYIISQPNFVNFSLSYINIFLLNTTNTKNVYQVIKKKIHTLTRTDKQCAS
jgi:hypothetical protein